MEYGIEEDRPTSADSKIDKLLALSAPKKEAPPIPEPLSLMFTLEAMNMTLTGHTSYLDTYAIHLREQIICRNQVSLARAKALNKQK